MICLMPAVAVWQATYAGLLPPPSIPQQCCLVLHCAGVCCTVCLTRQLLQGTSFFLTSCPLYSQCSLHHPRRTCQEGRLQQVSKDNTRVVSAA
jgi:hypothetical protein